MEGIVVDVCAHPKICGLGPSHFFLSFSQESLLRCMHSEGVTLIFPLLRGISFFGYHSHNPSTLAVVFGLTIQKRGFCFF